MNKVSVLFVLCSRRDDDDLISSTRGLGKQQIYEKGKKIMFIGRQSPC